jgi:hypothetical protein
MCFVMKDPKPKGFRTVRGAISGEEPTEPMYFAYRATLRIHGQNLAFDQISERLGVKPTKLHRKGERRGPRSPEYRDDAWHFQPALPEDAPLTQHIEALWEVLKPHVDNLKSLKATLQSRRFLRLPVELRPRWRRRISHLFGDVHCA